MWHYLLGITGLFQRDRANIAPSPRTVQGIGPTKINKYVDVVVYIAAFMYG